MYKLSIFGTFARSTATITVMLLLLIGAALGAEASTTASIGNFITASGQDPSPAAPALEVVNNFDNISSSVTVTTTIVGKRPMIAASTNVSFRSGVATTATRGAPASTSNTRKVMIISGEMNSQQIAIGQNETGRTNFDSRFKHMTNAATRGFMITSIALSNGHGGGEQALSSFL